MSEGTKIQWADDTWNPWRGCTKVSPGCKNCYAEISTPNRADRAKGLEMWGKGSPRIRAKDFDAPLRWNKRPWVCDVHGNFFCSHQEVNKLGEPLCPICPDTTLHRRRVFSLSLGDWLDDEVPIEWLADMLDVIRQCQNLDFLLLTKRPENCLPRLRDALNFHEERIGITTSRPLTVWLHNWIGGHEVPPNIWLGVSVEDQTRADERIPKLLEVPAKVRFISYEPALGPVSFADEWMCQDDHCSHARLDWIIVGGESGPKARPFNVEWARSTIEQCKAAGVACFVKQMGALLVTDDDNIFDWDDVVELDETPVVSGFSGGRVILSDRKGGDMTEWPDDLRVREFPRMTT